MIILWFVQNGAPVQMETHVNYTHGRLCFVEGAWLLQFWREGKSVAARYYIADGYLEDNAKSMRRWAYKGCGEFVVEYY